MRTRDVCALTHARTTLAGCLQSLKACAHESLSIARDTNMLTASTADRTLEIQALQIMVCEVHLIILGMEYSRISGFWHV
jgi:hypothetical protein